jgi:hypothetical protein
MKLRMLLAALSVAALAGGQVQAQTVVGTITACYFAQHCPFLKKTGPIDGPAFQITNTGTSDITGARFSILRDTKLSIQGDSFALGRIKAGTSKVIIVGVSDDRKSHLPLAFFTATGTALDTSDAGTHDDKTRFSFKGQIGATAVLSGTITAGDTARVANDGTVGIINFLGGPDDAPCSDCFGPVQIGTLTQQ